MNTGKVHERLLKNVGYYLNRNQAEMTGKSAKDFLGSLAVWAGKGRDELLQVICREIGQAVAGVIEQPITQLLKQKKLQITIELVSHDATPAQTTTQKSPKSRKIRKQANAD